MKLLFVGSEACLPEGFSDLVETSDLDASIDRVGTADAAFEAMQKGSFDLIVCESKLPDERGIELLASVATLQPKMVRILIDRSEGELDMQRALLFAHRVLPWPLDAELLFDTLSSVFELSDMLRSEHLHEVVGSVSGLPPAPKLYMALSKALADPKSDANQIANLVSQDPAISAKVMRMCNSAYFAGQREVSNVRAAITRLGLNTVRMIVLAAEVYTGNATGVDRDAVQKRAMLASAIAMKVLPGSSQDLAGTGALLAEVGLLVPGVVDDRKRTPADEGKPGHSEAGAYLLGLWGLPLPIVEAVYSHRNPQRLAKQGFWVTGAVHVATALAAQEPVDEDYLRAVGQLDKLAAWQEMAEELRARENG